MKLSFHSSDEEEKKEEKKEEEKKDQEIVKKKDEELCCLCFANIGDSVIMPCGHGGICNPCALELFSGCKDCPICRNVIFF